MKNEDLLNQLFESIVINNAKMLNKAQKEFVNMHYKNASLIDSKGFANLMGKTYQIGLAEFEKQVKAISVASENGAEIVFDYTDTYSYRQIERMMSRCGYLIYEHLTSSEMAKLNAPAGFHFVLAVKKEHLA